MPLSRSLAEVLGAHADNVKNDIRKILPGTVTAVHPDRQTVDVQIAVNNVIFDDIGQGYSEPAPSISDVPLCALRGGGMFVWVPVAIGDSVLVVFSDLSTDTWRSGDGSAADPGWLGKHTLDSPFAIPGIAPDAKFLADPQTDATKMIVGKDGGAAQIRISASGIELGHPATDAVALATKVAHELTTIATILNSLVAPSGGGPVTHGGPTPYVPGAVNSALVQCQ